MASPTDSVPVTVLTGFLGAGKTTLLNRILTEQHGRKLAVIENEFGEVGVDNQLVIRSDEEIFEMNNGCICCTVRGDLIRILGRLMKRKDRLDGILIETTGLADPGPVAQTFFTDDEMRTRFRLDAIVTVVDSMHVVRHIDTSPEVKKQIAFADVLILNKTDLVSPGELDALEARIRKMNAAARVHRARHADVPLSAVLDVGGFNLSRATGIDPGFLDTEYPFEWAGVYALPQGTHALEIGHCDHDHDHGHGEHAHHHHHGDGKAMDIVILPVASFDEKDIGPACEAAAVLFSDWENKVEAGATISPGGTLQRLQLEQGCGTFRVRIDQPGLYAVFEQDGHAPLHIAVMGQNARPGWQQDFHANHSHDDDVASVGISVPGDLDGSRLNAWISDLLKTKGGDIYRMKGVLSVKGSNRRLVFQGVHMLFDAKFDREWGTDPRTNTLVFIGKNLDRQGLTEAFKACLT